MRNIIGFTVSDEAENNARKTESLPASECDAGAAACIATVKFEGAGVELSYYNDRFDLREGDRVYVEGKYAGKLGTVTKISTKFKIRLSDYKRIIARPRFTLSGTFERIGDMMVRYGDPGAMTEAFRTLTVPPMETDEGYTLGEGFRIGLYSSDGGDDIEEKIAERAFGYCREGRVLFISVRNGVGTAFVRGGETYEVNFRIDGDTVADTYCTCPYPGLCKHEVATAIILNSLIDSLRKNAVDDGFTAICTSVFMDFAMSSGKITLSGEE